MCFIIIIKIKTSDFKQIGDCDLYLILFCTDSMNKGYDQALQITIADIEVIAASNVMNIPPENLVTFFKDLFLENS